MPKNKTRAFYERRLKDKHIYERDLVDVLMFVPLNEKTQIKFHIYKNNKTGEEGLDVRRYYITSTGFIPSKYGFRIPIEYVEQLNIRLSHIVNKRKRTKE